MFKWYWWRFNANGFFWGMATGIAAALVFPYIFTDKLPLYNWPLLFLISVIGCLVGTYTAPPTDMEILKKFYSTLGHGDFGNRFKGGNERKSGI